MLNNLNIISWKGLGSLFYLSFWLSLWFLGLGVLLSYFLRWWLGDQLLPVRLISYMMPWLLVFLVPGLIVAGLAQHKWLGITLLVPTIIISLTYAPLFLPTKSTNNTDLAPLKVMSYNVWRNNKDMTAVAWVITKEQPDIILLQELKPARADKLTGALNNYYPDAELHFVYEPKILQAVISRYPLTPINAIPKKGQAQKVLIETLNGPVTVFNIHPIKQIGWLRRHHQVSSLLEEDIATTDGPLILGGDFNTTDQTQTYRMVNKYLRNAHWEAGCGFGFTYPSSTFKLGGRVPIPPVVRIDHIFNNDYFVPTMARTLNESGGSDHFPVVAEFIRK